ncbi:Oligosaccharide repeat unit polymerase Wzy [Alkalibacterium sp. AK22]|uniref:O-antigen ligase family protein n=1 Tax=Alkalibacterium sp. AK22 TaxID=1229520 RepID=UPI0004538286|nr:O-antigen ligase family protein [Alkalibacterium sp. AK22]EXJ23321.1 Oligosaccharide repeat unit polymerase Wzy [Alkalibacterium sp. AK22]
MKKAENIILVMTIFANSLLLSTLTFTGGNYNVFTQSNHWTIIKFILFLAVIVLFIKEILNTKTIPKKIIIVLYSMLLLIILIVANVVLIYSSIHPLLIQDILIFGSRSIPVFIVGLLVVKKDKIDIINKHTQVITLYVSFALVLSFFADEFFITGNTTAFAGANYQLNSYVSAMMIGLNYYYAFVIDKQQLYRYLRTNLMQGVHIVLSILVLLNIFLTGGRGGVVASIIYTLIILIYILRNKNLFNKLFIVFIIGLLYTITVSLLYDPQFYDRFNRAFSFIGQDSFIDIEAANRTIFSRSISYIFESPIFGNGLGTYYNIMGTFPHNLFLQVLFEGGIILLIVLLLLFAFMIIYFLKLIKLNKNYLLILYITITHFTLLMFSSTYLRDDISWLFYGVVCGMFYKTHKKIQLQKNNLLH